MPPNRLSKTDLQNVRAEAESEVHSGHTEHQAGRIHKEELLESGTQRNTKIFQHGSAHGCSGLWLSISELIFCHFSSFCAQSVLRTVHPPDAFGHWGQTADICFE